MPYIPHTDEDRKAMLRTIGVDSIDELFSEIPESLRFREELQIPSALDENQLFLHAMALANENISAAKVDWYLGAGLYDRFVPASVAAVISRGEFLTAYTPYQPELSQGYLQSIYEFQSMVSELYGMEVANASMYDGATAAAEAGLMSVGVKGRDKIAVSQGVHPNHRKVIETYCWASGIEVIELPLENGVTTDYSFATGAAGILVQSPNFFGMIEDLAALRSACDAHDALMLVSSDPISNALLKPPGEYGADVVVGEGQPLGVAMGFGGPLVGLFAVKLEYIRRIPGRIVGKTNDHDGRPGFTMTLRTREQDIRREKATSNICTNEALMALAATVYMTALGKNGIRSVAETTVRNLAYGAEKLASVGAKRLYQGPAFTEAVFDLGKPAAPIRDALLQLGIMAGLPLGEFYPGMENMLLVAFTENRKRKQIDRFAAELGKLLG